MVLVFAVVVVHLISLVSNCSNLSSSSSSCCHCVSGCDNGINTFAIIVVIYIQALIYYILNISNIMLTLS